MWRKPMIEIIEAKDMNWIIAELEKINDRTKIHTKQIQELQREIKA